MREKEQAERTATADDAVPGAWRSSGREPPRDEIFEDLRKDMAGGLISPVFIGSAERGNGIGRLLKAIRHDAPTIADTRARLGLTANGDAVVQVMKTLHTQHGGKMSIARVLAGRIGDGATLLKAGGASDRVSGPTGTTAAPRRSAARRRRARRSGLPRWGWPRRATR